MALRFNIKGPYYALWLVIEKEFRDFLLMLIGLRIRQSYFSSHLFSFCNFQSHLGSSKQRSPPAKRLSETLDLCVEISE